ncbi:MAG: class II SORL domain-containing protein [Candidatus Scalindua sp.]
MSSEKVLFCKLNKLEDVEQDSPVAKKHVPVIAVSPVLKAGEFYNVKITVGEIEHPNENEHFIQWTEFYIGDVFLGRFDFTPVMAKPEVTIPLQLGHKGLDSTLRAISRCNLHGLWEGKVRVKTE